MAKKIKNKEEWIWVEGYKGVSEDMTGHGGFQYELGKQYDIPDGEEVRECENGFHFCLEFRDVFTYYDIENNNRFFCVKALCRAKDVAEARFPRHSLLFGDSKIASKSIILTEEIDTNTIFNAYIRRAFGIENFREWSGEDMEVARRFGVRKAKKLIRCRALENAGYTHEFAEHIADDDCLYKRALAVAALPGASVDTKALVIFGVGINEQSRIIIKGADR